MTTSAASDNAWADLLNLPPPEREARMLQRYVELGKMEDAQRQQRLLDMANAEYALSEEKLREFTLSRMRMFLKLPPDTGKVMAAAYDMVMLKMPGAAAMRRVSLVQTLAKNFTPEEESQLRDLNPNLFAGLPTRQLRDTSTAQTAAAPAKAATPPKGGWWPFGKK